MSVSVLALILVLLLIFGALESAKLQESTQNLKANVQASPSPSPSPWPNLDRVQIGKDYCGLDGAPGKDLERAAQNRLRNRYHLPQDGFEDFTLQDLRDTLPQGEIDKKKKLVKFPTSDDPNHKRAVSVVAYVTDVLILGCGVAVEKINEKTGSERVSLVPRLKRSGVESASCYVADEKLCTTQIFVTPGPNLSREKGRNVFVMNVTQRSRLLAQGNHLNSNIGNDWSTGLLKDKIKGIKGKWVRLSGWLFFNQNYREKAWASDPDNKIGKSNDRETAWSLHPVMGIEVDVPPPTPKN